jgi:hypothetical protein
MPGTFVKLTTRLVLALVYCKAQKETVGSVCLIIEPTQPPNIVKPVLQAIPVIGVHSTFCWHTAKLVIREQGSGAGQVVTALQGEEPVGIQPVTAPTNELLGFPGAQKSHNLVAAKEVET